MGRFRSKQIGCDKRLDLLTVDLLTEFHCIAISKQGKSRVKDGRMNSVVTKSIILEEMSCIKKFLHE